MGSIYVDCGKIELAKECYNNALAIRHTRAHQGLARVYHQKNQRKAAYDEMTMLIEKAESNASAYEKRSEYCDREMAKADLDVATHLDPLRTYPYRYRAAGTSFTSHSPICSLIYYWRRRFRPCLDKTQLRPYKIIVYHITAISTTKDKRRLNCFLVRYKLF